MGFLKNNCIIDELKKLLSLCDLVILIDISGANPLTDMICNSNVFTRTDKKIAIISIVNTPHKFNNNITYKAVTEGEMRDLLNVYRSYESSDKLVLFSDSRNYGSSWNYVNNGFLSTEEMFEAMIL